MRYILMYMYKFLFQIYLNFHIPFIMLWIVYNSMEVFIKFQGIKRFVFYESEFYSDTSIFYHHVL